MDRLQEASLDWFMIGSGLLGGIALLSFAMSLMSASLKQAFGPSLRSAIKAACVNRFTAFLTGTVSTAALTSATATSLLALSFIQAGDMTLLQGLELSLGINVGSTLQAHLLAIQIQRYGLALVASGYVVHRLFSSGTFPFSSHRWRWCKHVGESMLGLGLLFLAMTAISEGISPLRSYKPFLAALAHLDHRPALALLTSAACAVLFQSSNTIIGIAILLGQQGFLSLEVAVMFVLGSNVGTALTPLLAAWGSSTAASSLSGASSAGASAGAPLVMTRHQRHEGLRMAVAALIMKAVGIGLLLPFQPWFIALLRATTTAARMRAEEKALTDAVSDGMLAHPMSSSSSSSSSSFSSPSSFDDPGDDPLGAAGGIRTLQVIREAAARTVLPLQVANAHTIVNLWVALLFMPLVDRAASFVVWLLPAEGGDKGLQAKREGSTSSSSSSSSQQSSSSHHHDSVQESAVAPLPFYGGNSSSSSLFTPTLRSGQLYKHKHRGAQQQHQHQSQQHYSDAGGLDQEDSGPGAESRPLLRGYA